MYTYLVHNVMYVIRLVIIIHPLVSHKFLNVYAYECVYTQYLGSENEAFCSYHTVASPPNSHCLIVSGQVYRACRHVCYGLCHRARGHLGVECTCIVSSCGLKPETIYIYGLCHNIVSIKIKKLN